MFKVFAFQVAQLLGETCILRWNFLVWVFLFALQAFAVILDWLVESSLSLIDSAQMRFFSLRIGNQADHLQLEKKRRHLQHFHLSRSVKNYCCQHNFVPNFFGDELLARDCFPHSQMLFSSINPVHFTVTSLSSKASVFLLQQPVFFSTLTELVLVAFSPFEKQPLLIHQIS